MEVPTNSMLIGPVKLQFTITLTKTDSQEAANEINKVNSALQGTTGKRASILRTMSMGGKDSKDGIK